MSDEEIIDEYDQELSEYNLEVDNMTTQQGIKSGVLPMPKNVAKVMKSFNEDGSTKLTIRATKSNWVHNLIYLDGVKFDFTGRNYLRPVYDRKCSDILLKTARQVEKTTFLANNLTVNSVIRPYNKSLYVSPSHMQTRQFSSEKLKPAIEKSPYIKTYFQDASVSQQVFEKGFTNGSFVFLRSAFRSADRCLAWDTKVLLKDGSTKLIRDIKVGDEVISYDGKNSSSNKVIGTLDTGIQTIYRIHLKTGTYIDATENHTFITEVGEKKVSELKGNEFFPMPLGYLQDNSRKSEDLDIIVGLLGDGCLNPNRVSFNNNNKKLIDQFLSVCGKLKIPYQLKDRDTPGGTNYTVYTQPKEKIVSLLNSYNILGTGQFTKFIPEEFFSNMSSLKVILRGLFDSDGWVCFNTENRQCEIGFVTGSKRLAWDVHRGLQSLGIYSILETKQPKGRQKSVHYSVKLRNAKHIQRFSQSVGFSFEKQQILDKCILFINSFNDCNSRELDVPARGDCDKALKSKGISTHKLWKEHRISFRNNKAQKEGIALHKVEKISKIIGNSTLDKWLSEDVMWSQIKKIEKLKKTETHDIEIENDNTFCGNGIFTHNSRGISARDLALDEIQDLLISDIPVIMECTSHFEDSTRMMAGTPKSFDNPIEVYWQESSQNEWLVKCDKCSHWNMLDETNIAPTEMYTSGKLLPGPVCSKCMTHLRVDSGQWFSMSPTKKIQGFRIPQLMVPWIISTSDQWFRLLQKRDLYPFGQFANEVLGLSYDNASKPISRRELLEICESYSLWPTSRYPPEVIREAKAHHLCAGVDWGEGNDGSEKSPSGKIRSASYTVLSIGYYQNQKQFKYVFIKKYIGKEVDPDFVVNDITRICRDLDVKLTGVDWGHGWGVNNTLIRRLGINKVMQFQYVGKQALRLKWDNIGSKFIMHRNLIISEFFYDLKNGHVVLPRWDDFEAYAKDILGIYTEYSEYTREIKYDHRSSDPDDVFHSMLYAKQAADIYLGKSRAYTERKD